MNMQYLIDYIRQSCLVDSPSLVTDSDYLILEDKDIQVIIEIAISRLKSYKPPTDEGDELLYPIVLQAKKEIYYRLAFKNAPTFNISGQQGQLVKSQKFDHFITLAKSMEEEWANFIREQEAQVDVSNTSNFSDLAHGQIFLDSRYHSQRNLNYANKPKITLNVDHVYDNYVEISWRLKRINRFSNYNIYISNNNIIDNYTNEVNGTNVLSTTDIHKTKLRVKDLNPNTLYHIAVVVTEENGLQGYDELTFVTEDIEDVEEVEDNE